MLPYILHLSTEPWSKDLQEGQHTLGCANFDNGQLESKIRSGCTTADLHLKLQEDASLKLKLCTRSFSILKDMFYKYCAR